MIQLFSIFGKGGLVLWCFNEGSDFINTTVNDFVRNVIINGRSINSYNHEGCTVKYKLDNEFDLIFLIVYQSVVQLAYADKLLTEVHLRFRDLYKNVFNLDFILIHGPRVFDSFNKEFLSILDTVKTSEIDTPERKPRTFQESIKSKKTVASLIENTKKEKNEIHRLNDLPEDYSNDFIQNKDNMKTSRVVGSEEDDEIVRNRNAFFGKKKNKIGKMKEKENLAQTGMSKKESKQARKWDLSGTLKDAHILDYSTELSSNTNSESANDPECTKIFDQNKKYIGLLKGNLPDLDTEQINQRVVEEDEGLLNNELTKQTKAGSWFSTFKTLIGNKQLNRIDIEPVMETMKEILITKNVASEPAQKICESVAAKLEGKVIKTFNRINTIVRDSMRDTLVQLLTPKRRVDILRDIMEAKSKNRPYVVVFCGVNGVGKSTNLAKITFWLNENGHKVIIAAGDTFRAGAVEQLRTHVHHLNALHPEGVQLFEQGYGKDPATIAQTAIRLADNLKFDVVLIDTAGRMQDNEPLMRALSKLINVNNPDLVLFVGEALVGNEAVDQLIKFNQALADNTAVNEKVRLIDGIVLTKFDTIDDKVGAAISMTYITGQPIVFVGTGQTYHDLRNLNANAVVNSLMK